MAKQKALITGGCGFIGSYLTENLIARGFDCVIVDTLWQNSYANVEPFANKFQLLKVDITDSAALDAAFASQKPDLVFHLAAHHFIPYCDAHPNEAITTNVIGTQNVADSCGKHGVSKLFYASTAAVYGPSDSPHTIDDHIDPMDLYGVTKYAGEKIVTFLTKRSSVKVAIGRFFNAVGLRETNPHIIPEIIKQLIATIDAPVLRLGNVFPRRDYIHAADIAEATATFTTQLDGTLDIVNIGSAEDWSVTDLVEMFSEELGKPIRVEYDAAKGRKSDRPRLCADTSKLQSKYGWKPTYGVRGAVKDLVSSYLVAQ